MHVFNVFIQISKCIENIFELLPYPEHPLTTSDFYLLLQMQYPELLSKVYQYLIERLEAFLVTPTTLLVIPIFDGFFKVSRVAYLEKDPPICYCEVIGNYFYEYNVYIIFNISFLQILFIQHIKSEFQDVEYL